MAARPTIVQINLAPTLGGAEVFTAFMSRALAARGWPTRVIVDAKANFWRDLDFGGVNRVGARDGVAAAAALAPDEIALILMDATMPILGGVEAFDVIRTIRPDAKGILCSGFSEAMGGAAVREHGFLTFLKKPYSINELQDTLEKLFKEA